MNELALQIGGRTYRVACAKGEEDRVSRLGAKIDQKLASIGNPAGPDAQNLLFAALLLADEVQEARDSGSGGDEAVTAARRETEAALSQRDELSARNSELEADLARLQGNADELQSAQARQSELESAIAAHEADAAQLRAEIAELRETASAGPVAAPMPGEADLATLAPALEHLAQVLEECADKLERRAATS